MKYPELESSTLEFKEFLPKNNQLIKTLIAFCNQFGGKIIIGVDNTGIIRGLPQEEIEKALEHLNQTIYGMTYPPILPLIYTQTIGEKTILIIEVSSGMNKPYFLKSEGLENGTYIRLGRSTLKANTDVIQELKWKSSGRSYDTMPVYDAKIEDLDVKKIQEFFKKRKGSKNVPTDFNDALKSYNLISDEHGHSYPTVAGILLFGIEPEKFFSEAIIICSHFAGIEGRNVIATRDSMGILVTQFDDAYNFVLSQLTRSFTIKGPKRHEEYEIPEEALREAILNAIIHRNYHINAPIKIAIFDNRIEVFSPGSFPGPLNTKNLKMGLTYIRNMAITKVFREMGYIEKLGTGFLTIFKSYELRGLQEPTIIETDNSVKCILPRPSRAKLAVQFDSDDFKRILELFETATELTIGEVIAALKLPRSTASRKMAILVNKGALHKVGSGSGTKYIRKNNR
jgi:ATP-dependent DNA helicase RecG